MKLFPSGAQSANIETTKKDMPTKLFYSFDRFQKKHRLTALPVAVLKKYSDDQGGYLAATIAYYGLFAIFPMLLVFMTILGFFLAGSPSLEQDILHSALAQFPIIGDQIQRNVHSIRGSGLGLFIGVLISTWAGMGVVNAAQNAFNHIWHVPPEDRAGFLASRGRSLLMLSIFGLGTLGTTLLAAFTSTGVLKHSELVGLVLVLFLNVLLFLTMFKFLTHKVLRWRELLPGAVMAAILWEVLQLVGGYYVGHILRRAPATYGFFAIVIGISAWVYIAAQIVLLSAEVNVVRAKKLWPQQIFGGTDSTPET
jgi:YihY family inner membrane protein